MAPLYRAIVGDPRRHANADYAPVEHQICSIRRQMTVKRHRADVNRPTTTITRPAMLLDAVQPKTQDGPAPPEGRCEAVLAAERP